MNFIAPVRHQNTVPRPASLSPDLRMAETAEELSDTYSEAALVLFSLASACPAPGYKGSPSAPAGKRIQDSPAQVSYNSTDYQCSTCGKRFHGSAQYQSHLQWCNGEENIKVDVDVKDSEDEDAVEDCPYCSRTFSAERSVLRHLKRCEYNPKNRPVRPVEISPASASGVPSAAPTMPALKLTTPDSARNSDEEDEYDSEESNEEDSEVDVNGPDASAVEVRWPCPSCRVLTFPSELEEHLRACLEDPPLDSENDTYSCPKCKESFANPFQATQHVRACWFNKPVPGRVSMPRRGSGSGGRRCLLSCACGATFSTERAFNAHAAHCQRAGSFSSFEENDDFDDNDGGSKVYSCRRCGKKYPTSQSLAGHARHCVLKPRPRHSVAKRPMPAPASMAPPASPKPSSSSGGGGGGRGKYTCANCNKKFTTSQSVAGHARHCNLKKHPKKKVAVHASGTPTSPMLPPGVKRGPGRPPKTAYIHVPVPDRAQPQGKRRRMSDEGYH